MRQPRRVLLRHAALVLAAGVLCTRGAEAAEECKAQIKKSTGVVHVNAANVGSSPRWGTAASQETNAFFNQSSCFSASKASLKDCTLADPATLAGRTPPETCVIFVADDGPSGCSAFVRGCTPGLRTFGGSLAGVLAAASFETGGTTLRFTGVNLQVVDGSGTTGGATTGLGNLIIGYNEDASVPNDRSGSHNLVIGPDHSFASYGGIVAGRVNTVSGPHAAVKGGVNNLASGVAASVGGGIRNQARGDYSSVIGGGENVAHGFADTVGGGYDNQAHASFSSVSGGYQNHASADFSSVSGGLANYAEAEYASVTGGYLNQASGTGASVSGGEGCEAAGAFASVSGGRQNEADGYAASASGGDNNYVRGSHASVSGGSQNQARGTYAHLGGGRRNLASGFAASVSGGDTNVASGDYASITGGRGNVASGSYASVSGGSGITAASDEWHAGASAGHPTFGPPFGPGVY